MIAYFLFVICCPVFIAVSCRAWVFSTEICRTCRGIRFSTTKGIGCCIDRIFVCLRIYLFSLVPLFGMAGRVKCVILIVVAIFLVCYFTQCVWVASVTDTVDHRVGYGQLSFITLTSCFSKNYSPNNLFIIRIAEKEKSLIK